MMRTTMMTMTTMTMPMLRWRSAPTARMSSTATGTSAPLLTLWALASSLRGETCYSYKSVSQILEQACFFFIGLEYWLVKSDSEKSKILCCFCLLTSNTHLSTNPLGSRAHTVFLPIPTNASFDQKLLVMIWWQHHVMVTISWYGDNNTVTQ